MPEVDHLLSQLSSSQGQRDETANIALAERLAAAADQRAIALLAGQLTSAGKAVQHDCMKVLYEIGSRTPVLLTPHLDIFIDLLQTSDNRMQWGAMKAISEVAQSAPQSVYPHLSLIVDVAQRGSVITRDRAVVCLTRVATVSHYREECFWLLLEILKQSPPNQFPSYSEQCFPLIPGDGREQFRDILQQKLPELTGAKRKRVEHLLSKL